MFYHFIIIFFLSLYYDVIDFASVAKRRSLAKVELLSNTLKINDVIMTSRSYPVTARSYPFPSFYVLQNEMEATDSGRLGIAG